MSFQAAADWLTTNGAAADNTLKLEIYGLYKYVLTGGAPTESRPAFYAVTARAKYDAWTREAEQPIDAAKDRYIAIAQELGWKGEKGRGMGVHVSTMQAEEAEGSSITGDGSIHDAVLANDLTAVRALPDVDLPDRDGNTPLHLAADRGFCEMAELLLTKGANREAKDGDDQTPLDIARLLERDDMIKTLS